MCAGGSLEFCRMKRFFKIKISTYNTIGHKFISLKVDFRPGVSQLQLGFVRVSTDSRFCVVGDGENASLISELI